MKRREIPALSCLDLGGWGSTGQDEHDRNLQRYSSAKKATLSFIHYVSILSGNIFTCNDKLGYIPNSSSLSKIVEKVEHCGDWLHFLVFPGEIHRLANGFFCKKFLWCVGCAIRRSGRLANTYLPIIIQQLKYNSDLLPVLITWTIKNRADIGECFKHLKQVQCGLLQYRRLSLSFTSRLRRRSPLRHLHGGVGSYEFKRGKDGGWNLHIHELALVDRRDFEFTEELVPVKGREGQSQKYKRVYVPRELASLLAQELWLHSGDSYILDVRGLYSRELYSRLAPLPSEDLSKPVFELSDTEDGSETAFTPDSLFSGLCEAFKYALKFDELSHEDWLEAATKLERRRLIYSYGCLHGAVVPEDHGDDIEDELRNQPFYEKVYRYYKGSGYILDRTNSQEDAVFPPSSGHKKKISRRKSVITLSSDLRDNVRRFVEKFNLVQDDKPPF
jgi:hypothetical protein